MSKKSPLKQDIKMLGALLGETIKEQVGEEFFVKLEQIRLLSKRARKKNDEAADKELKELIRTLSNEEIKNMTRAFGQFLNLANITEGHHSMNELKLYDEDSLTKHLTQLTQIIPQLLADGRTKEEVNNTIANMNIELVMTAHPTEVKRRTLLHKHAKISQLLDNKDHHHLTPSEIREVNDSLSILITSLWESDEIRRIRPTPFEEAKWGLAIIEDTVWDAIPRFMRELDNILEKYTGQKLPNWASPIKFASWMGGDRDGNPNVTFETTERVCLLNRWTAAELYYQSINNAIQCISSTSCSDELRAIVGDAHEPYRAFLRPFRARFLETKKWAQAQLEGEVYKSSLPLMEDIEELREALNICHRSLAETSGKRLADASLLDLMRRLSCFGLNILNLDIRQESTRHMNVINAITEYLGEGSYADWPEDKKQEFLVRELQNKRPLMPSNMAFDEECQEVVDTVKTIAQQPPEALGAYVISMARTASDVLAVHLLQKECGVQNPLRVAPLFETLEDLENSGDIMEQLFSIDWYKNNIDGAQEVMIGYSDSGKDAGKLAASWAQYTAQEALHTVSKNHNVKLTLFHGRGGSVGRGGGPVEHALMSQPPGTVAGRMRVTEQGEVIQQKYSTADAACYNLHLYIAAVLQATLAKPPLPKQEWRDIMDSMSKTSCDAYRDIVRGRENFVKYFRQVTPEQELGRLHIGSRPAKRKKSGGIESLRAIPWIFAWTQTRSMLPAWLGIGEALDEALKEGHYDLIQEMIQEWPFFYFIMDMLDMVLVKTDYRVSAYYEELLADDDVKDLGIELRDKLKQTIAVSEDVVAGLSAQEDRIALRASIKVRNPYADTLNYLQGEVMRRLYKENQDGDPVLEDAVMATIAGIAAAMKNTG
ncbi:phosphoenolpyruvate carboxylase [Lentisphaera profundi]|uniref:Phosphoenolpyruvate carboxylase n=1 Tax=Lentisphaera profundi TaxID=1658616 RepID=A0ABY7VYW5_9BACT|nr:phosphoenolpyruvate carboxylase [Lentisphaera profundi]WDE97243.1 phosphoenolpyruvate carboxylase [Lentisphaera profundi]